MEYKFLSTINGPVVVGDEEVIFFHEFGPLQDYIDSDPEFFKKAYEFLSDNMRQQADLVLESLTKDVVGGDWVNRFNLFYGAFQALKQFEHDTRHLQGFPGPNGPIH